MQIAKAFAYKLSFDEMFVYKRLSVSYAVAEAGRSDCLVTSEKAPDHENEAD